MVVRAGREFLAIPGPTTMPDEVLRAMHRPPLDIYSDAMVQLTYGLLDDLRTVFATKGKTYIYIANGHGAWEATISNVLSRGDKILVLESGRFAVGWGNAARLMGVEVQSLKGDWNRAIRPAEVEAALRQDTEHNATMSSGNRHHCKCCEQWKTDHRTKCCDEYFEPERSWRHSASHN